MKKIQYLWIVLLVVAFGLGLVYMPQATVAAQNGGTGGSGSGDQDRTQDQDQVRDPTTHDGTEPDQLRQQDQDRLNTTTVNGDQLQLRDQDRDRIHQDTTTPPGTGDQLRTQERAQVREHASTSEQLHLMIQERTRELEQAAVASEGDEQLRMQNENRVRLAVHALQSADTLLGPMGQQVAAIAQEMGDAHTRALEAEKAVASRSFLARLFFGGDRDNAQIIANEATANRTRIEEMKQLLLNEAITEEVRTTLQTQLSEALMEQIRLEERANAEIGRWGIFSWRF